MINYLRITLLAALMLTLTGCHDGTSDPTVDSFNVEITLQSDAGISLDDLHYYLFEYPVAPDLEDIRNIYPNLGPAAELVTLPALSADFEQAYTEQPDNNTLTFNSIPTADYVLWVEGNTVPTQRFLIRAEVDNPVVRIRSGSVIEGLNLQSDTTLTLNIYEVTEEIVVGDGVTLTIAEGTELRFAPDVGITVDGGRLHISSSAGQPVLFLGREEIVGDPHWQGIRLHDPIEPFQLDRALFMHADTALAFTAGGNISLSNSIFVDNGCALHGEGDFQLSNLRFSYNDNAISVVAGTVDLSGSIFLLQSDNGLKAGPNCRLQLENNWFEACYRALDLEEHCRGVITQNVFSGMTETVRLDTPDSLDISFNTFHATELLDFRLTFTAVDDTLYIQENNLLRGNLLNPILTVVSHAPADLSLDLRFNYWHTTSSILIESHFQITGNVEPDILPLALELIPAAGPWGNYPYGIH